MQRALSREAAWIFLLALITGGLVPAAQRGILNFDAHAVLAAHLGALMSCFLLLGVAWTLPLLRYKERGQKLLGGTFIVASYANWALTLAKARLHVAALSLNGDRGNDAVFVALLAFVVAPALAAAVGWVAGFSGSPSGER